MSERDFWKLDRTFNILFIVITLVIAPAVSINIFKEEEPNPGSRFLILYFLVPTISLILLWWWATFFDKLSLRIVCWYGLFYLVIHAFWIITSMYIDFAYGKEFHQSVSLYAGMGWIFCAYCVPSIPAALIYRRYSNIQEPTPEKVLIGIFIFVAVTFGLAFCAL